MVVQVGQVEVVKEATRLLFHGDVATHAEPLWLGQERQRGTKVEYVVSLAFHRQRISTIPLLLQQTLGQVRVGKPGQQMANDHR
ncbi:hypothetical protein D3C80_1843660 [compost metagenome]